jgi:hypothetical protein
VIPFDKIDPSKHKLSEAMSTLANPEAEELPKIQVLSNKVIRSEVPRCLSAIQFEKPATVLTQDFADKSENKTNMKEPCLRRIK